MKKTTIAILVALFVCGVCYAGTGGITNPVTKMTPSGSMALRDAIDDFNDDVVTKIDALTTTDGLEPENLNSGEIPSDVTFAGGMTGSSYSNLAGYAYISNIYMTVGGSLVAADMIDSTDIADGAVEGQDIASGAISNVDVSATAAIAYSKLDLAGVVTNADLSPNAVSSNKILDANVTLQKLEADAVDGTKLADDACDSEHYTDASIDPLHLAGGISNALIDANAAISHSKIEATVWTSLRWTNNYGASGVTNVLWFYPDGSVSNITEL